MTKVGSVSKWPTQGKNVSFEIEIKLLIKVFMFETFSIYNHLLKQKYTIKHIGQPNSLTSLLTDFMITWHKKIKLTSVSQTLSLPQWAWHADAAQQKVHTYSSIVIKYCFKNITTQVHFSMED